MYLTQGLPTLGHGSPHFLGTLRAAALVRSSHNKPVYLEYNLKYWRAIQVF